MCPTCLHSKQVAAAVLDLRDFLLSGCSQLWFQVFLAALGFQGLSQLSSCKENQTNNPMCKQSCAERTLGIPAFPINLSCKAFAFFSTFSLTSCACYKTNYTQAHKQVNHVPHLLFHPEGPDLRTHAGPILPSQLVVQDTSVYGS